MRQLNRYLREPTGRATLIYFGVALVPAMLLMPLLFNGHPFEILLKICLAAVLLLTWWQMNSLAVLIFIQCFLLVSEPSGDQSSLTFLIP